MDVTLHSFVTTFCKSALNLFLERAGADKSGDRPLGSGVAPAGLRRRHRGAGTGGAGCGGGFVQAGAAGPQRLPSPPRRRRLQGWRPLGQWGGGAPGKQQREQRRRGQGPCRRQHHRRHHQHHRHQHHRRRRRCRRGPRSLGRRGAGGEGGCLCAVAEGPLGPSTLLRSPRLGRLSGLLQGRRRWPHLPCHAARGSSRFQVHTRWSTAELSLLPPLFFCKSTLPGMPLVAETTWPPLAPWHCAGSPSCSCVHVCVHVFMCSCVCVHVFMCSCVQALGGHGVAFTRRSPKDRAAARSAAATTDELSRERAPAEAAEAAKAATAVAEAAEPLTAEENPENALWEAPSSRTPSQATPRLDTTPMSESPIISLVSPPLTEVNHPPSPSTFFSSWRHRQLLEDLYMHTTLV